jgi:hypothetical protein
MKPRELEQDANQQAAATGPSGKTSNTNTQSGKKNNAKSTTAAGRKIARKTAHSLIERRRRSKMNEEFGVLKDMIPACQGQEMHKLAILSVCIFFHYFYMVAVFSNNRITGRYRVSSLPRTMRDRSTGTEQQSTTTTSTSRSSFS